MPDRFFPPERMLLLFFDILKKQTHIFVFCTQVMSFPPCGIHFVLCCVCTVIPLNQAR